MTPLFLRLLRSTLKTPLYPVPKTSILNDSNSKVSIPAVHSLLYSSILLAPPKMSSRVSRTSSFQRHLESPFSHSDIYGTKYHIDKRSSKKPRKRSSSVKLKTKTRLISQRTFIKSSVHKRRKSRHDKVITPCSHKLSTTSIHSSTRQSSLAQVDCHLPNITRQIKLVPILSHSMTGAPPLQSHSLSGTASRSSALSTNQFLLKLTTPPSNQSTTRSAINIRLSHTSASLGPSKPLSFRRDHYRGFKNGDTFTVEDLARGLVKMQYKKIIVMSGAGISTTSGIPDFRTPGSGLYDNLKQYRIPEPSAIFDITFFFHNPRPFFTLAKDLYPGKYSPNIVHYFIRLLQDKGYLLRTYTQNIDGLERLAGIKTARLVEAHGSFSTASCTICHSRHDADEVKSTIFKDRLPRCKHKFCSGVVKPDIVFFGEDLPQRFYSLRHMDFAQCDLLFIMGTSLEVEPFASLATMTRFDVPRILINREVVGPFKYQRRRSKDVVMTGDLVDKITELVTLAGWEEELQDIMREKGVESTVERNAIETPGKQNVPDSGRVFDQTTPTSPDMATPGSSSENNVTTDNLTESFGQLNLSDKKK